MVAEAPSLIANLEHIRERVARAAARAGRRENEITLVAVSKTVPAPALRAAHAAGMCHFGENRVQEFEAKQAELSGLAATWHFIGHLQSNKARRAAQLFNRIDSIDDLALARKLDEASATIPKRLPVLIEVHLGGEASKSGAEESTLPALAEAVAALPHLELLGLMTIPPYFEEPWQARPFFRRLRELRDDLSNRMDWPLPVLSMGMSHDFETAIEEGATEVRLGTALFGARGK